MGERSQRYESPRAWPSERERVSRGRLMHEGDEEDAVGGGEEEVVRVLAKEVQQAEVGVLDYFEPLRTRRVQLLR